MEKLNIIDLLPDTMEAISTPKVEGTFNQRD